MIILLLQTAAGWETWLREGISISLIILILGFILKLLPSWKEVKLAEIDVRKEEAKAQVQIANSLGALGTSLNQISTTMNNVAIEQRRATDNVKILYRATADENSNIINSVDGLMERMDSFEEKLEEKGNATRPKTK